MTDPTDPGPSPWARRSRIAGSWALRVVVALAGALIAVALFGRISAPIWPFDTTLVLTAMAYSFHKLSPRLQFKNPVMFVVLVCSVLTTLLWAQALAGHGEAPTGFIFWVSLWLWFTLLFANFAEALAEGRGKAQADALRGSRKDAR